MRARSSPPFPALTVCQSKTAKRPPLPDGKRERIAGDVAPHAHQALPVVEHVFGEREDNGRDGGAETLLRLWQ